MNYMELLKLVKLFEKESFYRKINLKFLYKYKIRLFKPTKKNLKWNLYYNY